MLPKAEICQDYLTRKKYWVMLAKAHYEKESRGPVVNGDAQQQTDCGKAQGNRQQRGQNEMGKSEGDIRRARTRPNSEARCSQKKVEQVTSQEIKDNMDHLEQQCHTGRRVVPNAFQLWEIAYQLAVMNERLSHKEESLADPVGPGQTKADKLPYCGVIEPVKTENSELWDKIQGGKL